MASSAGSRALWLLVCALAMCQVASAVTPEEVVGVIQEITALSGKLGDEVEKINVVNVLFRGPRVAPGIDEITILMKGFVSGMDPSDTNTFKDKDAEPVVQALKTYKEVDQRLLNDVIGKHGLLSMSSVTEPVRVALASLESVTDAFAMNIIGLIPSQAPVANQQFASLDSTLNAAIHAFS